MKNKGVIVIKRSPDNDSKTRQMTAQTGMRWKKNALLPGRRATRHLAYIRKHRVEQSPILPLARFNVPTGITRKIQMAARTTATR